ncbi:hypothetical protein NO1_1231 [Candidatus Termititenax aidoneus]|uniref:Uncharacterized protein n=1 Tax=Termititenax aidoneus TaxID=2218524 RepID=A0A388TC54_TERA1|nr:hypothetical protein NO1_1231 [Candidatus Termititenax aidoneus]
MIKTRAPRHGNKYAGFGTIKKYFKDMRAEINQNSFVIKIQNDRLDYENHSRNDLLPQWVELLGLAIKDIFNSVEGQ